MELLQHHYDDDDYEEPAELSLERQTTPPKLLYISHLLSTWNSRAFEFGAALFLAEIYPGILLPMSVYSLIGAAAAIVFSHRVGRYIDTTARLPVIRVSIVGQRMSVVFSCLAFLLLLTKKSHDFPALSKLIFGVSILLGCVERLCSIMNTVAVERDWVIVIADKDESLLQELNSQMRRIDLFCKLVAPLAIALLDGISTEVALLTTLSLNACSAVVEYLFIAKVYQRTPALAQRGSIAMPNAEGEDEIENDINLHHTVPTTESLAEKQNLLLATLKIYCSSAAFLPSLALSMLYLTVLSFAGQMTTFLLAVPNPKMDSSMIGLLRTVATVFELSATWIAPRLMTAIGPVRAGIWCLGWQVLCLTPGVGILWSYEATETPTGVILFVVTVVLSRTGLWSFDLVAQLLIQNSIDASQRGAFSSAETSLQNSFSLCAFAMTIVFSKPEQFKLPAFVSLVATCCAAATYAKFVRDRRGHLVHMPSCLKTPGGGSYEMMDCSNSDEQIT